MDNVSGKVLAQLKFKRIDGILLRSLKIEIIASDTAGRTLGEPIIHSYLDLQSADVEFGSKIPIYLQDNTVRSFNVRVIEAVLDDGTVWEDKSGTWESLPAPTELNMEPELLKQYRMEYGQQCRYKTIKVKDLWYCACGNLNRKSYCSCGLSLKPLSCVDMDKITEHMRVRLEEEKRIKAENDAKANKRKNKVKIIASVLILVLITVIGVLWFTAVKPSMKYNEAVALMEIGKYEEAIDLFEELGTYKNSSVHKAYILDILYDKGNALMEDGEYESAIGSFELLSGYKDSYSKINECKIGIEYNKAVALMEEEKYEDAITVFEMLDGYKDSDKMIDECWYNKAVALQKAKKYEDAIAIFETLGNYKDSATRIQACKIRSANK